MNQRVFETAKELADKHRMIKIKLAELSYINPDKALEFMREFGEHRKPLTTLLDDIMEAFEEEKEAG